MGPCPGATRWALLAALTAGGCDAPSLDVLFEIPERYRADVTSVRLQVLEPPVAAPFDCDAVALGLVDEDTLRLSQTLQVAVEPGGDPQPLVGIRREGRKLLVGEGFDATSRRLTAACREHGDVDGATEIVLPGEPAALLDPRPTKAQDEAWVPDYVDVVVTDGRDDPLAGARVSWTVVGPGREEIPGVADTAADGTHTLPVECTSLSGPALLDMRVRWQNEAADPLRFFQAFKGAWTWKLAAPPSAEGEGLLLSGRIGPAGQLGFVVGTHDAACDCSHVAAWFAGMPPSTLLSIALPEAPLATAAGMFARGDRDVLVLRSAEAWLELSVGDSALAWVPAGAAPTPPSPPQAILDAAPCGGGSRVLVAHEGGQLAVFDALDGYVEIDLDASALADLRRPFASGCVDSSDGVARRVVAFGKRCPASGSCAVLDDALTLAVDDGGVLRRLDTTFPPLDGRGVGFTPSVGGADRLLLALDVSSDPSSFIGEGVGLGRYRLATAGNALMLERVARDDTTLLAASPVGGDFDGDGLLDVSSLLLGGDDGGAGPYELAYFTVLGVEHPLGTLFAALDIGEPFATPPMVAGDYDGDGRDDVLILQPASSDAGPQVVLALFGEHGGACRGVP